MIYNSAGHHLKDSGAIGSYKGKPIQENLIAIQIRDGINKVLTSKKAPFIKDDDKETLAQYLGRIKPGTGSVVVESHLNASTNKSATGIEVVLADAYDKYDMKFAKMVAEGLGKILGIPLRNGGTGVITESQSHRGKLGLVRKPGITAIVEYCFISNEKDVESLLTNMEKVCEFMADCLIEADSWLT